MKMKMKMRNEDLNPNLVPQHINNPYHHHDFNPFATKPQFNNTWRRPDSSIERIDTAVAKDHRDLVAARESVSAWKVSQAALLVLKAESWKSLGVRMQLVPSLKRLILVEGKVPGVVGRMAGRPFGLGNRVQFGAGSLNQTATVQWRLDELPGQGLNDGLRCRVGLDRAYTPRILLVYYTLPPWCKPVRTSHVAPVMVRPCASVSYLLASLADAGMCRYYMIRSSNVALIHSCCMEPSYNILHRSAC